MRQTAKLILGVSTVAILASGPLTAANAQDETLRQGVVTVTGSFIKGTPENAALPVDVVDREELDILGSPSVNEILRNLPATQGLIAETNQFDTRGGQGNEGATTINLRGLGSARTLVLYNGHRHVSSAASGVDVNFLPSTAVSSIEVLKDGAAALYGSDAIGGVVNFRTRNDFEGFEVRGTHQFIDGSDGDSDLGFIFGHGGEKYNFMVSAEVGRRGELQVKDRDWALLDEDVNPQGGWSNIGGPGRVLPAFNGTIVAGGAADPQCDLLGGTTVAPNCRFQYTFFDNLIEKTETTKIFSTFDYELLPSATLSLEAGFSEVDVPEWNTSPSYPPQSLFGPDRFIAANHPGLVDFRNKYPDVFANGVGLPAAALGAYTISRMVGVAGLPPDGSPETGSRNTQQTRLRAGLVGELFDGDLSYDFSATYSKRERETLTDDMSVERMAFAIDGLGGPGCDPATGTPGVGPCQYYNPFSNAIAVSAVNGAVNPDYNPAVANSPELLDWLVDTLIAQGTDELLVFDAVFSGGTNYTLGGGNVEWAVGAQSRNEKFNSSISDNANLALNPCPFNNPMSVTLGNAAAVGDASCPAPTGQYAFLAGSYESSLERTIYGVFGELALPFSDNFDVQLALRFEDYGGDVGSTIDPKIAAKWQITDDLALRGSASTTFRGPPQGFLQGRTTSLEFLAAANAFKAVDTVGNENLEPETAFTTNFGVLYSNDRFRGSVDYWRFDFESPLQLESAGQIIGAYTALGCQTDGAGAATPECASLQSQIFPFGTPAAGIERVERGWINGSDITTSGIDFYGSYLWDVMGGELTTGLEGTYTLEYESEDFLNRDGVTLAPGGDFVGFMNEGTPFQSLIDLQANAFARYQRGPHNFSYTARYKAGYEDAIAPLPSLEKIDSHLTHDISYNLSLFEGKTRLSASVYNLTDEDPPLVALDLNYDPYQHNAFGRMIKIGFTQQFGVE